jgi:hypothetical protein
MLSGSSPNFALSNHTTFSQTQTGATIPFKLYWTVIELLDFVEFYDGTFKVSIEFLWLALNHVFWTSAARLSNSDVQHLVFAIKDPGYNL